MKFISWNVNGLRAILRKDFKTIFADLDADFVCLQETKIQAGQVDLALPGYHQYYNYAVRKGYSGTAIFTKHEPLSVSYGINIPELDQEGRAITLEYGNFYLVTCYTPNSQPKLRRLKFRLSWDAGFRNYVQQLAKKKPVIICGDLNVAREAIDLKNPQANHHNAGFSDEERQSFEQLLDQGFIDTFRHFYPDKTGAYSWWSYRFHARDRNAGWRIDYFLISQPLLTDLQDAKILDDIFGSDHCPVQIDVNQLRIEA